MNKFLFKILFDKDAAFSDLPPSIWSNAGLIWSIFINLVFTVLVWLWFPAWVGIVTLASTFLFFTWLIYRTSFNAQIHGIFYALNKTQVKGRPRRRIVIKNGEEEYFKEDIPGDDFVIQTRKDKDAKISEEYFRETAITYLVNKKLGTMQTQNEFFSRKAISVSSFQKRREALIESGEWGLIEAEAEKRYREQKSNNTK